MTTISVKNTNRTPQRQLVVALERMIFPITLTQKPFKLNTTQLTPVCVNSDSEAVNGQQRPLTVGDNDITQKLPESDLIPANKGSTIEVSSPFKNDNQRYQKATRGPSGHIQKRKHDNITDKATASLTSKSKRGRMDPPVSTKVSVQEFKNVFSLLHFRQNSAEKHLKHGKRSGKKFRRKLNNPSLVSLCKLSKNIESITEPTTPSDDTENISLDVTPTSEIPNTCELNYTDPNGPVLIDSTAPIDVTPAVDVAADVEDECESIMEPLIYEESDLESEVEVNTKAIQTTVERVYTSHTQTEIFGTVDTSVQTIESGINSNLADIIDFCKSDPEELINKLSEKLNDKQLYAITKSMINLALKKWAQNILP